STPGWIDLLNSWRPMHLSLKQIIYIKGREESNVNSRALGLGARENVKVQMTNEIQIPNSKEN
ncbi:MAG: hypothetical protein AAB260_04730, partial [Planctomycetota bacterium]